MIFLSKTCAVVLTPLVRTRYAGRVLIENLLGTLEIEQFERPETQLNPGIREWRTQFPTDDPAKHL